MTPSPRGPIPGTKGTGRKVGTLSHPQPPCCPTCLTPMLLVGKQWECPKHGKPTRP